MRAFHLGLPAAEIRLREVMGRPLPQLETTVLLGEAYRLLLAGNAAVVTTREGQLSGIVTRADLMTFYEKTPQPPDKG